MEPNFVKTLKKIATQEARLQEKRDAARKEAIEAVNNLIEIFNLKPEELNFAAVAPTELSYADSKLIRSRGKVAPKYRLPDGRTWTGRGKTPVFIREALAKGAKLEDFLIAS